MKHWPTGVGIRFDGRSFEVAVCQGRDAGLVVGSPLSAPSSEGGERSMLRVEGTEESWRRPLTEALVSALTDTEAKLEKKVAKAVVSYPPGLPEVVRAAIRDECKQRTMAVQLIEEARAYVHGYAGGSGEADRLLVIAISAHLGYAAVVRPLEAPPVESMEFHLGLHHGLGSDVALRYVEELIGRTLTTANCDPENLDVCLLADGARDPAVASRVEEKLGRRSVRLPHDAAARGCASLALELLGDCVDERASGVSPPVDKTRSPDGLQGRSPRVSPPVDKTRSPHPVEDRTSGVSPPVDKTREPRDLEERWTLLRARVKAGIDAGGLDAYEDFLIKAKQELAYLYLKHVDGLSSYEEAERAVARGLQHYPEARTLGERYAALLGRRLEEARAADDLPRFEEVALSLREYAHIPAVRKFAADCYAKLALVYSKGFKTAPRREKPAFRKRVEQYTGLCREYDPEHPAIQALAAAASGRVSRDRSRKRKAR